MREREGEAGQANVAAKAKANKIKGERGKQMK
jgi:hypothetical protein